MITPDCTKSEHKSDGFVGGRRVRGGQQGVRERPVHKL